jgi:hypothetical protein
MAEQFLLETSLTAEYRITAPDGTEGDVYDFGDQAHVITRAGETWACFVNKKGECDGMAYRIAEPGSLAVLEEPQAMTIDEPCEAFDV